MVCWDFCFVRLQVWIKDKITIKSARDAYESIKKNVKAYIDNLDYLEGLVRKRTIQLRIVEENQHLAKLEKDPVFVPFINAEFVSKFSVGEYHWRRPFLVLDGASKLGKSIFATKLVPPGQTFETNCAGGTLNPNLRPFDPLLHTAIIFDEASADLVIHNKKLFQGLNQEISLGQSACQDLSFSMLVVVLPG